jgi:hypothetical protein
MVIFFCSRKTLSIPGLRYPFTSLIIAIGRLGMVLLVALSYPLQCHPCRACIHTLSTGWKRSSHQPVADQAEEEQDDDEDEQGTAIKSDPAKEASRHMARTKFGAVTTGIIVAGLAVAMVIDELEVGELAGGVYPLAKKVDRG